MDSLYCRYRVSDEGSLPETAQYGSYTISLCMFSLLPKDLNFIFQQKLKTLEIKTEYSY